MKVELKENERIDDLEYKGLKIIQNTDGFCFGIDSILLSDFAKNIKKGSKGFWIYRSRNSRRCCRNGKEKCKIK